jgi:glycosyltransferase involved in cell wall biosynthesis
MRILFANHTGAWSGAEVSLLRLIAGLRGSHAVSVACPGEGPLADAVREAGVDLVPLPAVDASLRIHPLQTPVGAWQIASGGWALTGAARRVAPDVIHANTIRAGLMAAIARHRGAGPVVVRAHEHLPANLVGRSVLGVLSRSAEAVVANSDYTAARLDEVRGRPFALRVYNSIDHDRFDPHTVRPAGLRDRLGVGREANLLGHVAQITPWKGQDVSIRALAQLRAGGLDAHLAVVGQIAFGGTGVRHDNHAYLESLHDLVRELGVGDAVHFLGQRDDVPEILAELDLSILPSWEEPFGLAVVESMAMGVPPLVTSAGAGPELVEDRVTGRLLPPRDPAAWAEAARELLSQPDLLRRIGTAGPRAAARFRDDVHAREMLVIYERATGLAAEPSLAREPKAEVGSAWRS